MNYARSSAYPPGSPQAKLADRSWRWLNSWWIFAPLLGCGFLSFLGFLVAAIRTGKKHYWVATAVYALTGAIALTLIMLAGDKGSPRYDLFSSLAMLPLFVSLFAPIIHAAIKNRDYLTTLAYKGAWYIQPPNPAPPSGAAPSFLGVAGSDYYSAPATAVRPEVAAPAQSPVTPPPASPRPRAGSEASSSGKSEGLPDINQSSAADLVASLGVDEALAAHVIAAREIHGRFTELDDLARKAGLQPHHLIRFRNKVTFGGPPPGHREGRPPTPPGRILDY